MKELVALAGIVGVMSVGVVSPGPSFVMVARMSVAGSRSQGVAAALGMGLGGMVFAIMALLGMQAVLIAVPTLYFALKLCGGLYLCYLGFLILRGASEPLAINVTPAGASRQFARSLWRGLATQLSNPKTSIVYASVFAAFLPQSYSLGFGIGVALALFAVETSWYTFVALLLSSEAPRKVYLGCKTWIDRVAGALLFGLGVRLIVTALDE
ncbi:LysE family translocator [Mitsuaria sp. 7]|uniref:LysE family translocator n=1 Tax=Mitsuaria sp. 7 TaxID=1658665 RepID=UPI0007DE2912|nr:LysE family transporter [Mitsuaria sp. 7]ANH67453.1 threonine transporter [Mitsuaria sp. 7]